MKNIYLTKKLLPAFIYTCIIFLFLTSVASAQSADTLKLKFFIQGYYIGGGMMDQVLYNEGVDTNYFSTNVDTVIIELHVPSSVSTVAASFKGVLQYDGTLKCIFPDSITNHAYYIVIKHRNALETWSAAPVTMQDTVSYDFSTDSTKAYGHNMVKWIDSVWSIYTGDITDSTEVPEAKDGVIDMYDYTLLATDVSDFVYGYYETDFNGDGNVDIYDYPVLSDNIDHGVAVIRPGNATCTMIVAAVTDSAIACHGNTTKVTVSAGSAMGDVFGATSYTGVAAGTYTYTLTDAYGCSASSTITITQPSTPCIDTLKLKFFIQGYYIGGGMMDQVLYNEGVDTNYFSTNVDTVIIELHVPSSVSTVAASFKGVLQYDGTLKCIFPDSITNHAYYIVIKHRNALETWSAAPVTMQDTVSYDFSTDSTKAYGHNMVKWIDTVWSIYTGDITDSTEVPEAKDGVIDMYDYTLLATDVSDFVYGYYETDFNGDGNVDIYDYPVLFDNIDHGVAVIRPGNTSCSMTVTAATDSIIKCHGGVTSVTVTASGATGEVFGATSYTGVAAGTYTYTLTDAYNCTASSTDTVTQPSVLTASITSSTNVSCYGGSNGSATVSASGGTSPYAYSWSGGATTTSVTGLAAGTYTVTVTDVNGCSIVNTATITQSTALTATITNSTNISFNDTVHSTAIVTPDGGTPAYTYSWSGGGGTYSSATGLTAGTYSATVTDANGCTATTIAITFATDSTIIGSEILAFSTSADTITSGDTLLFFNQTSGFPSETYYIFHNGNICGFDSIGGGLHAISCADTSYSVTDTIEAIYSNPGSYRITFTAVTPDGNQVQGEIPVIVQWIGNPHRTCALFLPQCDLIVNGYFDGENFCPDGCIELVKAVCPNGDPVLTNWCGGLVGAIIPFESPITCDGDPMSSYCGVINLGDAICDWTYVQPYDSYGDVVSGVRGVDPFEFDYFASNNSEYNTCNAIINLSGLRRVLGCTTSPTFNGTAASPDFVPTNYWGSQNGYGGSNAYIGLECYNPVDLVYDNISGGNVVSDKALAIEEMQYPMVPTVTYQVTLYVALAGNSTYAVNGLGVRFADADQMFSITDISQIQSTVLSGITDMSVIDYASGGWTEITGTYTSTSNYGEQYIYIGDFLADDDPSFIYQSCTGCAGGGQTGPQIYCSGGEGTPDESLGISAANYYIGYVSVIPVIDITMSSTPEETYCTESDIIYGTATASPYDGSSSYSFLWSTGATTSTISGLVSGTYSVTVTDANGCTGSASVTVTIVNNSTLNSIEADPCGPGCMLIYAPSGSFGGTPPYFLNAFCPTTSCGGTPIYYYPTGDYPSGYFIVYYLPDPDYVFVLTDANGCQISAGYNGRLAENDTNNTLSGESIKLYPNPSDGKVNVIYHLSSNSCILQLFDVLGNMVGKYVLDGKKNEFEFDMGDLCCGIFEYRIMDSSSIAGEGRLVIIR